MSKFFSLSILPELFLMIAILTGIEGNFRIVLIYIFLMAKEVKVFIIGHLYSCFLEASAQFTSPSLD